MLALIIIKIVVGDLFIHIKQQITKNTGRFRAHDLSDQVSSDDSESSSPEKESLYNTLPYKL